MDILSPLLLSPPFTYPSDIVLGIHVAAVTYFHPGFVATTYLPAHPGFTVSTYFQPGIVAATNFQPGFVHPTYFHPGFISATYF